MNETQYRRYVVTVYDLRFSRADQYRVGEFASVSAAKKAGAAAVREQMERYGGKRADYEFSIVQHTRSRRTT